MRICRVGADQPGGFFPVGRMHLFSPARSGSIGALCLAIAMLPGCGGGSSSTSTTKPSPTPVPTNCSLQIEAFDPPAAPSGGGWNQFQKYILPAVSGVDIVVPWNSIETSQQQYDFSSVDSQLPYFSGKKVNLIFQPISYSNINNPSGGQNTMTPSYVFTTTWASSLTPPSPPQDVAYCAPYPGNGTLLNSTANVSSSGFDPTGYPAVYEPPFQNAYQHFIQQVLQHYTGNTSIGYIRFGLSVGNETDAYCTQQLQALPAPNTFTVQTWENWIATMDSYEKSVLPTPPIQLMQSLNELDIAQKGQLPGFEAQEAVMNSFGFGNNGLQKSDIAASSSNTDCTGNWCALFDQYASSGVPLELQTATKSDPSGSDPSNVTGNLLNLIPVAVQHHATILEVLLPDLELAFNPNYAPPTPSDASFASDYASALNSCSGAK